MTWQKIWKIFLIKIGWLTPTICYVVIVAPMPWNQHIGYHEGAKVLTPYLRNETQTKRFRFSKSYLHHDIAERKVKVLKYNYSEPYDIHQRPPRVRSKSFLLHLVQFHSKAETFLICNCCRIRIWLPGIKPKMILNLCDMSHVTCGIRSCWTTVTVYKITDDFNSKYYRNVSPTCNNSNFNLSTNVERPSKSRFPVHRLEWLSNTSIILHF